MSEELSVRHSGEGPEPNTGNSQVSGGDWKCIGLVAGAGLFGGVFSYLWALTSEVGPIGQSLSLWIALPLYSFGGIVGSLVGVFLLAGTARSDLIRLGVTGLVFGVFWVNVLEQARGTVAPDDTTQNALALLLKADKAERENDGSAASVEGILDSSKKLIQQVQADGSDQASSGIASDAILRSAETFKKLRESNPGSELLSNALNEIAQSAEAANLTSANEIKSIAESPE